MADEGSSSSYHPEKKQANNCLVGEYSSNWVQTSDGELNNNQTIDKGQTSNWDWVPNESTSNCTPDEATSNQFQAIDEKLNNKLDSGN